MADQRLEILQKKLEAQYTVGSPILLEASALYLDKTTNNCIAQLKWKNIDPRPIKAIMIELVGYDAFNQRLDPVHYQYDGLLVTQGSEFGGKTPIMIKNNKVVKYDVLLKAVSFSDETIWRSEEDAVFEVLPKSKPQTLEGELLDQLKRNLSKLGNKDAAFFSPQRAMGLWQCGCGSWQYANTPCLKCTITQKALCDISDESGLTQDLAKYKDEQKRIRIEAEKKAEEARMAREKAEVERKEKEEAERVRREEKQKEEAAQALVANRRKKKIGIILAAVLIFTAGVAYTTTQIIIPKNQYSRAEAAFQNNQYVEAYEAFSKAGNYKDAKERAKCSAYAQAEILFHEEDYEQSYIYFQNAQDYNDAVSQSNAAALLSAKRYRAQFDYQNAGIWYQKANDSDGIAAMANIQSAAVGEKTWLHTDTKEKPLVLPDNIFLTVTTTSSGKYSTTKEYGVLKTGENGWATSRTNYSWVNYYPDQELILAGTGYMCTIIDLRNNSFHDVQDVRGINSVSDDGLVIFHNNEDDYSWENNGIFNRSGDIIVTAEQEGLKPFSQGLTPFRKNGLYGYINTKGETVIDYQYTAAESFDESGYAKVKMDEHKIKEGDMYVTYEEGWGLIDLQGNHIIEPNWYDLELEKEYLNEGFVLVKKDYRYGLVDLNDRIILEPKYSSIGYPSEGLIYVRILEKGEQNYPCTEAGWVDYSGKMVIDLISKGIDGPMKGDKEEGQFVNGVTLISQWKKRASWSRDILDLMMNKNGQILWEESKESSEYVSIDSKGYIRFSSGRYAKAENGAIIYITNAEYESGREKSAWEREYAEMEGTHKVNLTTAFYQQWSNVGAFSAEGIAKVALNADGPYGFVTDQSKVLVDAIYEDAGDYYNGYAPVKTNGKWGYIDATGKTILEPQYLLASSVSDAKTVYVQNENGTYSLLGIDGHILLAGIQVVDGADGNTDGALPTPSNNVFVQLENQDNWMQIDAMGNRLF